MKNLLFILILIGTINSCTKDDKYPQKWQLIKIFGGEPYSVVTGIDLDWQEFYLLNADGSFIKSKERDGVLKEASGTYTFVDLEDGKYLQLIYQSDNDIIGSCTSQQLKEMLFFETPFKLIGTWHYCDGPGLEYQRIE